MSTTSVGQEAEGLVVRELQSRGHKVIAKNWRTRRCEIDIVSTKDGCAYMTEVKYRGSRNFGDGFDCIGPRKLKQMAYAAEIWVSEQKWAGDYRLMAASVDSKAQIQILEI